MPPRHPQGTGDRSMPLGRYWLLAVSRGHVGRHQRTIFALVLLLNQAQRPILEFLRNVTPQVLLASVALILWAQLDFGRFDFGNWLLTLAFFLSAAIAVLGFLFNINQFIDSLLDTLEPYQHVARRLRWRHASPRNALLATLKVMFRRQPSMLAVSLLVVVVAAINAARTALR